MDEEKYYYIRDDQNRPIITVCLLKYRNRISRGIAICSKKDQFCKKIGRIIARSRAFIALSFEKDGLKTNRPTVPLFYSGHKAYKSCYNPELTKHEQKLLHRNDKEKKENMNPKLSQEGKKESKGKLNYAAIPLETLNGVVRVFEKGSIKYNGYRTWMPGIVFSKLFSAILRHLIDWFYFKKDKDDESGEHPLAHVIANCMMLLTYIQNKQFDDRNTNNKNDSLTYKSIRDEIRDHHKRKYNKKAIKPIHCDFASKERLEEEESSEEYYRL